MTLFLYMRKDKIKTMEDKVGTVLGYLRGGTAETWANRIVETYITTGTAFTWTDIAAFWKELDGVDA
jgi:hypothetical protein